MGSPRVRRDPAAPTKGSGRPPSAAKVGSSKVPAPAAQRTGNAGGTAGRANNAAVADHDAAEAENDTSDAIGAPASKRVLRSQGRRTMRKLLNAAMVAFDKRGYHATRVNDVVEIAKTSHGTFYLYFSNKEDLLRALVAEAASEAQTLYDALSTLPVRGEPPRWEDVHGWVRAYSALWTRYAPLFRAWTDLATIDPDLVDAIRGTFTDMRGTLGTHIGPDSW